ncbi:MAG TPA: DUF948 domain-containing protein [Candidatus Paceibacterota bacterium]|nr:DUF948 domain-containing protein [Candidatus Paceibacterota bacterium]
MDELLQTNIFFFITSIAVIIFAIGFCVLLYFLIPLARDAREIAAKFRHAAEEIEADFEALRGSAEEEGAKTKALIDVALGFLGHFFHAPPRRRRKRISRGASTQ